ncbi:hypothetical protein STAS_12779 [Striga asiatica]|uniref:Uncharacterized protein n=1 Tax=Striga asiatica TaxID=4170 RepID=A0A5A7PUC7_STRAF|nr:hypothetical protein STAS_12779 [Striga asiatica]
MGETGGNQTQIAKDRLQNTHIAFSSSTRTLNYLPLFADSVSPPPHHRLHGPRPPQSLSTAQSNPMPSQNRPLETATPPPSLPPPPEEEKPNDSLQGSENHNQKLSDNEKDSEDSSDSSDEEIDEYYFLHLSLSVFVLSAYTHTHVRAIRHAY